jgi:predicted nucleic acid-binding protein
MQYRLLTNDAITIAVMDKLGLSHLITDIEQVPIAQKLFILP